MTQEVCHSEHRQAQIIILRYPQPRKNPVYQPDISLLTGIAQFDNLMGSKR